MDSVGLSMEVVGASRILVQFARVALDHSKQMMRRGLLSWDFVDQVRAPDGQLKIRFPSTLNVVSL